MTAKADKERKRLLRALAISSVIAAGASAAALVVERADLLGFRTAEWVLYDRALQTFSPKAARSDRVVVLALDERTFEQIRANPVMAQRYGNWPYNRALWADLVKYFHGQGAAAIALDMVMDEPGTDLAGDVTLGSEVGTQAAPFYAGFGINAAFPPLPKVIAENRFPAPRAPLAAASAPQAALDEITDDPNAGGAPAVVLTPEENARALAFPVKAEQLDLQKLPQDLSNGAPSRRNPIPPIAHVAAVGPGFGLVEMEEDADGVLRRTRFAYADDAGNRYVTLPVAVAADLLGAKEVELSPGKLRLGSRVLRIDRDGSALVDFAGPFDDRFTRYSLYDVAYDALRVEDHKAAALEGAFRGKVVLVGGTAIGTADVKATPFSSKVPGVAKQAAVLDALLGGRFLLEAPFWQSALLAVAVSLLTALSILRSRSIALEIAVFPALAVGLFAVTGLFLARGGVHLLGATAMLSAAVAALSSTAVNHLFANRERERMRAMFSKYLSKDVVAQLADQSELPRLTGDRMLITAFFSDIRGFSTFSEKFKDDPEGLVAILNTYLTRVSAVLQQHGACLDKYIGDAVVCIFGAPVRHPDHAIRACRGALAAQAEVARIRQDFASRGLPDVYTRVGLNSANMFVGNVGSEQLFNYTAIGDGMNLASRLEGANKAYGTGIMIGPQTYELAKDAIEARELDFVRVAGKHEPVQVYELLSLKGELPEQKRRVCELYAAALAHYRKAEFAEAVKAAERALELDAGDGPSQAILERCKKLMLQPPPQPFEPVINLGK